MSTCCHYRDETGAVLDCDCDRTTAPREELLCATCGLETQFWVFQDCKACSAACIVASPAAWESNRRFYESVRECAELDAEIARQREALGYVPNLRVRQAS